MPDLKTKDASPEEPPVADIRYSSAHLILNPAAGGAAMSLDGPTGAARERGIRVRILEPGESVPPRQRYHRR